MGSITMKHNHTMSLLDEFLTKSHDVWLQVASYYCTDLVSPMNQLLSRWGQDGATVLWDLRCSHILFICSVYQLLPITVL